MPQPVTDLSASQSGNSVVLTFSLPKEALDHRPLKNPLTVEIYRDFRPAGVTPTIAPAKPFASAPPSLEATIPAAVIDNYTEQGRMRYSAPLSADDFAQHPGAVAVYTVRTRASAKKESPDSNAVPLRVHPAPEPIEDLKAEVTHSGIQLAWTPPLRTPVGPAPPIARYLVYRAALPPAAAPPESGTVSPVPAAAKIAETEADSYLDAQFDLGKTYAYTVRSVVSYDGDEIESADSNSIAVVARDVSPPAAPRGLIVVFVPAQDAQPAHLELSWGISPETDVAGYHVYRSEQAGVPGARLNSELLQTPSYQDMNAVPGRTYFYSVTAVDRSGNESQASPAVSGSVPAENQQ